MSVTYYRNQVSAAITCVLAFLFFASPAFAQEWVKYRSQEWGFEMEIPPGSPVSVTDSTYESWTGFKLPAKTFTSRRGAEKYSVMVVDYRTIQQLGREKLKKCTPGLEICTGTPLSGEGYWKHDLRGASLHAVANLIKRDVKVVDLAWDQISRISTTQVSMINNADQSRNYALVTMKERLMYIVEGSVPANSPSAVRFGGSFGLISKDGSTEGFDYPSLYSNEIYGIGDIPAPPPAQGAQGRTPYIPYEPDEFC